MPVNAEDLPPEVRKRLGIEAKPKRRNTGKGSRDGDPCPGECVDCGEKFPAYTKWERHSDRTGHRRWRVEVEVAT